MPVATHGIVVLDTETTGLDPRRDRVIEIGAVQLNDRLAVTDRFTTLVDPGRPIPLMIQRMTGIADADVAGAPSFAEAFAALREFAGEALVVGQNLAFDLDMLAAEATRAGLAPLSAPSFDTLEGSLLLFPELDRHNLREMAEHLALRPQSHRALPDAEDTAALFVALCRRAAALPEAERRLLEAAEWAPLRTLDRCRLPHDEAPPVVAGRASGRRPTDARPATGPAALDCQAGDWRLPFAPDGALAASLSGFVVRQGQTDLGADIADRLEGGGIGLLEAGTGTGKSLAYLLPAAFHGAAHGCRVVVSTKTKALQRQLAERELPLVQRCLPSGWRWSLLMGRENYLCRRRLDDTLADAPRGLPDRDRLLALAYLVGRDRRSEVDLSSLPYRAGLELPALGRLGRELRSTAAACSGRRCRSRDRCPWRLARSRADESHLLCVNHALLLTGGDGLPGFDDLIIDEAHFLPDEVVSAFTERVDRPLVEGFLDDVRGRRGQRPLAAALTTAARRADPQAAEALRLAAGMLEHSARELAPLVDDASAAIEALVAAAADPDESADRQTAGSDGYASTLLLTAGLQEQPAFDDFATAGAALAACLAEVAKAASLAADALPDDHRERAPVVTLGAEAAAAAGVVADLTAAVPAETVAWIELEGRAAGHPAAGRRGATAPAPSWALSRAPLSPAVLVRERLWERLRSAVLVSATLAVAGTFDYFRERAGLGADLDVVERVFPSPFDYPSQAALVLEHDPDTPFRGPELPARQAERLRRLTEVTGGRLLALFTNKRHLEEVAGLIGGSVEDDGVVLLAQGLHGGAAALAEEFRNHPATVLLGVDALWTGQDFPGDVLVCLVIAKLPFPRQDALFRARARAADEAGHDWFRSFYLPEAVLRFRQGCGRLIRSENDRGVLVVLDHRLTQRTYEAAFVESLPPMPVVRALPDELPQVVGDLLAGFAVGAGPNDS